MLTTLVAAALLFQVDDAVQLKEVGMALPKIVGKFQYDGRHDYKVAGGGYSIVYANKMCRLDIYVYDGGLTDIPDGKANSQIDEQLQQIREELRSMEKRGLCRNVKKMDGDLPLPMDVLSKFGTAGFTFDVRGGGCHSYALVTGRQNHFVKIRATQFVVDGKTNDDELHEFLKTFSSQITSPADLKQP